MYFDEEEVTLEEEIMKPEHHSVIDEGTAYEDGIEAHLDGVSMQVVKHRMDALIKERIRPLIGEYDHCCEVGVHEIILEKMVQKKD